MLLDDFNCKTKLVKKLEDEQDWNEAGKKKTPHELTIKTQQRQNGGGEGKEWGREG